VAFVKNALLAQRMFIQFEFALGSVLWRSPLLYRCVDHRADCYDTRLNTWLGGMIPLPLDSSAPAPRLKLGNSFDPE
jgi:hypothetical protein